MANDIKIDLRLTGEQGVTRGLKNVGDQAENAGSDLEGMAKDAGFLDKRLVELRGSTKELAAEFARAGDQDLFKKLKIEQRELAQLEKLKKLLTPPPSPGGKGWLGSLAELGSDIKGAMGVAQPAAIAGATVLGAAISPIIGSAISAGVLGAVGAGGIAGGIALAARDSRVQAEAAKLGETISQGLTVAGEPFIGPVIESIRMLDDEFGDTAEGLRGALSEIAPVLLPLTEGLDGLVDKALPGLTKGLQGARPVLRAIGNELPDLGEAAGDFFEDMAENADAAAGSIKALSQSVQFMLGLTSGAVGSLSSIYLETQKFGVDAAGTVAEIAEELQYLAPVWSLVARGARTAEGNYRDQLNAITAANSASKDFRDVTQQVRYEQFKLGGALSDVTGGLEIQRKAMLGLVDATLGLRGSTRDIEEAIDSFAEAARENGTSLDISTEAGRRNQAMIDDSIRAVTAASQAIYEQARATGSTALEAEEAAARYRASWIPALEAAAIKAGFNRDQVQQLMDVLNKLDGRRVTYTLVQKGGKTIGAKVDGGFIPAGNEVEGRASGGPVYPGQMYRVGEHGPELIEMGATGGHVYNAAQSAAMMGGAAGATVTVHLPPPVLNVTVQKTGVRLDDVLMESLAYQLRVNGGIVGQFQVPDHGAIQRYEGAANRTQSR